MKGRSRSSSQFIHKEYVEETSQGLTLETITAEEKYTLNASYWLKERWKFKLSHPAVSACETHIFFALSNSIQLIQLQMTKFSRSF